MNEFPLKISSGAFLGSWWENKKKETIMTNNIGAEIWLKSKNCSRIIFNWPSLKKDLISTILISIDHGKFYSKTLKSNFFKLNLNPKKEHLIRIMTQTLEKNSVSAAWKLLNYFCLKKISYNGELVGQIPKRGTLIFLGDSILNGKGINFPNNPNMYRPDLSWDFLMSEKLNLNNIRIAYQGIGITNKAKAYPPTSIEIIWQISKNIPRIIAPFCKIKSVIVNLGSNDKKANKKEFLFALKALVRELKKRFHEINIIVIEPFDGSFKEVFENFFHNYKKIFLIQNKNWLFETKEDIYLSKKGHKEAYKVLLPLLKDKINA